MALARQARKGRGSRPGPPSRPGILFSALLHLGLAALVVLASWQREKPPEPLPPPAYEVAFEAGAPERPAQEESAPATPPSPEPAPAEAVPEEAPAPPVAAEEPTVPETAAQALPEEPAPPPPPAPEEPRTAEADPAPPPAAAEVLPAPPPAPPQREAALTAPPRPARPPPPSERLPGLYMPDVRLNPAPPRPDAPRRGLDLSPPSAMRQPGRDSPEAQLSVRGAQIGPDWRNAFRRWMDEHGRYPTNAAVVGDQGTTRIELIVEPDGRVRSGRLVRRSGSVWLDAGTVSLFRNAVLPPFPPGADPSGVTIDLTINYILVR